MLKQINHMIIFAMTIGIDINLARDGYGGRSLAGIKEPKTFFSEFMCFI